MLGNAIDRVELVARRALDHEGRARAAMRWYRDAGAWVAELATARYMEPTRVAGIVSALSPQNGWADQLLWIPRQLDAMLAKEPIPGPGFGKNKIKALRIMQGEHPADVLRGPKVRAFWRNLSGDLRPVTVDRWAYRIAMGEETGTLTAKRYRDCEAAFVAAAVLLGMEPAECQALTWCYWRDMQGGEPW